MTNNIQDHTSENERNKNILSDKEHESFCTNFDSQPSFAKAKTTKITSTNSWQECFQVESVLNVREQKDKLEFDIKWKGDDEKTCKPKNKSTRRIT